MKFAKTILAVILSLTLSNVLLPAILATTISAQTTDLHIALQRGYRTGYSDGYMSGYRDRIDNLSKSYVRHDEYSKGDRAYITDYGTIEDYRDGYQQGFEAGYDMGFDKRTFETNLPNDLKKRANSSVVTSSGTSDSTVAVNTNAAVNDKDQVSIQSAKNSPTDASAPIILIPRETELVVELQEDLSTDKSRTGEKFTAKVVAPAELAGAMIEGRVSKITQPGRLKRRSELALSFDRINISDARWSNFSAMLTEVMPVKGDNIKLIDAEGTAIGQGSYKGDIIKIGTATGGGLLVGGLVGGPVGAAVGAGMGAAFGVGAVVIDRGKHIRLNRNQQLRIKTACESRIR